MAVINSLSKGQPELAQEKVDNFEKARREFYPGGRAVQWMRTIKPKPQTKTFFCASRRQEGAQVGGHMLFGPHRMAAMTPGSGPRALHEFP